MRIVFGKSCYRRDCSRASMTLIAVADRYTHVTGLIRLQVLTTVRTKTRRSSETLLRPPGSCVTSIAGPYGDAQLFER
jgi:hypothetical protein